MGGALKCKATVGTDGGSRPLPPLARVRPGSHARSGVPGARDTHERVPPEPPPEGEGEGAEASSRPSGQVPGGIGEEVVGETTTSTGAADGDAVGLAGEAAQDGGRAAGGRKRGKKGAAGAAGAAARPKSGAAQAVDRASGKGFGQCAADVLRVAATGGQGGRGGGGSSSSRKVRHGVKRENRAERKAKQRGGGGKSQKLKRATAPSAASLPSTAIGMHRRALHEQSQPEACEDEPWNVYNDLVSDNFEADYESEAVIAKVRADNSGGVTGTRTAFPQRLTKCVDAWRAMGAPPHVIKWLRQGGVDIKWASEKRPVQVRAPANRVGVEGSPEHSFARDAIDELLASGCIEEESAATPVRCVAPLSVVAKGDPALGKFRLIIDTREANKCVTPEPFKMRSLHSFRNDLHVGSRGSYLLSADLSSAYMHVPLLPVDRQWNGLAFGGKRYRWCSLAFGQQYAPVRFCAFTDVLTSFLNNGAKLDEAVLAELDQGTQEQRLKATELRERLAWDGSRVPTLGYVDDLLIARRRLETHSATNEDACRTRTLLINAMDLMGWCVNIGKSHLTPATQLEFLGVLVCVQSGRFKLPSRRVKKVLAKTRAMIDLVEPGLPGWRRPEAKRGKGWSPPVPPTDSQRGGLDPWLLAAEEEGSDVPVRQLASLAGSLQSCRLCIGRAVPVLTRSLFKATSSRIHAQQCVRQNGRCTSACWRGNATTTAGMLRDLYAFEAILTGPLHGQPIHARDGNGIEIKHRVHASTDASDLAVGGVLHGSLRGFYASMNKAEVAESSMVRELAAVDIFLAAMEHGEEHAPGRLAHGTGQQRHPRCPGESKEDNDGKAYEQRGHLNGAPGRRAGASNGAAASIIDLNVGERERVLRLQAQSTSSASSSSKSPPASPQVASNGAARASSPAGTSTVESQATGEAEAGPAASPHGRTQALAAGTAIFLRVDSLSSKFVWDRGGSGHVYGDALVLSIFMRCIRNGWQLYIQWVPREDNTDADLLSKAPEDSDFGISHEALIDVCARNAFNPEFDLFASAWSRIAPDLPYASRYFMRGSAGDAWFLDWGSLGRLWVFPPLALLNDCVQKLMRDKAQGILIAPARSKAPWRRRLAEHLVHPDGVLLSALDGHIGATAPNGNRPPSCKFAAFPFNFTGE